MAIEFVVEDGTGKSDATSYISVADMKQYWDNMEYDYSALSDAEIQALLNKATQIIDGQYFNLWPGTRSSSTQALQWPRSDATYPDEYTIASTEIPKELPDAASEMAYASNQSTTLQPISSDGGDVKSFRNKVDVIEEQKEFWRTRSHPKIPAVDDVLRTLLGRTGGYGRIGLKRA